MANVRVLVIGDNNLFGPWVQKGDVFSVVPAGVDWGNLEVAPKWIRMTIKNVQGTQQEAEDTIRGYLERWRQGFLAQELEGAAAGLQRYRVAVHPDIGAALPGAIELEIRNAVLSACGVGVGAIVNQQPGSHFTYDCPPLPELAVIYDAIDQALGAIRRYRFSAADVDNALNGVPDGQPAEVEVTAAWVRNNVLDKLRGG